jgi:membrane-bound ClpP family serine protease
MKRHVAAFFAAFALLGAPAQAANIYNGSMVWTGIPAIKIEGPIVPGDEEKFAAVAARRQGSVVVLSSPGGSVGAAILIGQQVRELGLDTFAGRAGEGCSSACPMILLSGRHVVIQRGTPIGFHAATGPEGTQAMAEYLSFLGFTARQINKLLSIPNDQGWFPTPADAAAMGFSWQTVPSLFGGWRSCQAKYCLAVP